jgi:RNA-directed DNA polymerase
MEKTRPFHISKQTIVKSWELVKANAGSAGADHQSIQDFERNLKDNLYKIWNRMSSGSYFPPPVKAVPIPKKSGGVRMLNIPTVSDRVAQTVVTLAFESIVEPHFLPDSYGYRPNKSALDAVGITRLRCWQYDWVLEFDIVGLFDNIPRELLMKAVHKHTDCKWIPLCIERWLNAPVEMPDGSVVTRTAGTAQGGVISPVLSNLFLHYAFDKWMKLHYPLVPWCRYADDGLVHCSTEQQAKEMLQILTKRLSECGLQLHPDKTKIVYCKDSNRRNKHTHTSFDFLGYTFRSRLVKSNKNSSVFVGFTPAVSNKSKQAMREKMRRYKWQLRSDLSLEEIANTFNPVLQGWINYYGRYGKTALIPVGNHFNAILVKWAMRKHKKLRISFVKATHYIEKTAKCYPKLFAHWAVGMRSVLIT